MSEKEEGSNDTDGISCPEGTNEPEEMICEDDECCDNENENDCPEYEGDPKDAAFKEKPSDKDLMASMVAMGCSIFGIKKELEEFFNFVFTWCIGFPLALFSVSFVLGIAVRIFNWAAFT